MGLGLGVGLGLGLGFEQTTTVLRSLEARAARLRRREGRILSRLAKRA